MTEEVASSRCRDQPRAAGTGGGGGGGGAGAGAGSATGAGGGGGSSAHAESRITGAMIAAVTEALSQRRRAVTEVEAIRLSL